MEKLKSCTDLLNSLCEYQNKSTAAAGCYMGLLNSDIALRLSKIVKGSQLGLCILTCVAHLFLQVRQVGVALLQLALQ